LLLQNLGVNQSIKNGEPNNVCLICRGLLRIISDARFVVSLHFRAQNILAIHGGYHIWSGRTVATGHRRQDGSTTENEDGATGT
jgi:hypothetical protein